MEDKIDKKEEICICGHSKYRHEGYGFVDACLDCSPARKCKKFILDNTNIQFFIKEKVEEAELNLKQKIANDIKKWDVEACCHGIQQRDLVKYLTGEVIA